MRLTATEVTTGCIAMLRVHMAQDERQITVGGEVLGSELKETLRVVQVSYSWVAVHVAGPVKAVRWDYGLGKQDTMTAKSGWAFFAQAILPLDGRGLKAPEGTTVTALDSKGKVVATAPVPSDSVPPRIGGVDACRV